MAFAPVTLRERFNRLTESERQAIEKRLAALEARTLLLEERWKRIIWQVQAVVKSIIRQYIDRRGGGK